MRGRLSGLCILLATAALTVTSALGQDSAPGTLPLRDSLAVPVIVQPTASSLDRSLGQQWRLATMKLSGSMCPACLIAIEDKLKKCAGINFAKVEYKTVVTDSEAGKRTAPVIIVYDAQQAKLEGIIKLMKSEKYKVLELKDVEY